MLSKDGVVSSMVSILAPKGDWNVPFGQSNHNSQLSVNCYAWLEEYNLSRMEMDAEEMDAESKGRSRPAVLSIHQR